MNTLFLYLSQTYKKSLLRKELIIQQIGEKNRAVVCRKH